MSTVPERDSVDRFTRYVCPRHGGTDHVIGMGGDRPPLCASPVGVNSCGQPCERVNYVPEAEVERLRDDKLRLRERIAKLEWGLRCIATLQRDEDPRRLAEQTLDAS